LKLVDQVAIFSDLDGTLIDHETYSAQTVAPVVRRLRDRAIPICICSSKTRKEIELYRSRLGIDSPFISENGGAVFFRDEIIEFGVPYLKLVQALREARRELSIPLRGFHELSASKLSEVSGLPLDEAELALKREYDEAFWIDGDLGLIHSLRERLKAAGLRITSGARFFHLTGNHDKGTAVELLAARLREGTPGLRIIGIGDSVNDVPLLQRVDEPFLVRRPDGRHDDRVTQAVPGVRRTEGIGPEGWVEAATPLLQRT
jgi:mannosyl-3-phosphoglycerate phosphatase